MSYHSNSAEVWGPIEFKLVTQPAQWLQGLAKLVVHRDWKFGRSSFHITPKPTAHTTHAEPSSPLRACEVTNITVLLPLGEQISFTLPGSPIELADFETAKSTLNNAMGVLQQFWGTKMMFEIQKASYECLLNW